jgi:hypothetical protein
LRQLRSEIVIESSAEGVWQVLTDFDAFPEWNPFISSISGEASVGARLEVHISPPSGMGMTFKPRVLSVETHRELRWLGRLLLPGLFDGLHSFVIDPIQENRVSFVQGERFTGLLVPLFGLLGVFKATERGFEAMNQALKERSEGLG